MINFCNIFLYFIIYSFFGYLIEVMVVSFERKKITNRGFLCGPICPVYGVGAILFNLFLSKYENDYIAIFLLGAIMAASVEYFTGWILEKVFKNKWWDYSKHKYNLNGRVCLSNAISFGLGALIVVEITNPLLEKVLNLFNDNWIFIICIPLLFGFIVDMFYSWKVAFNLRHNIIIVEDLKKKKLNSIPDFFEKNIKNQRKNIKKIPQRFRNAFPNFITNYKIEFDIINKLLGKPKKKEKKKKK